MSAAQSSIYAQIAKVRKELTDKRDRIREELIALGHEPRRLSADKRSSFSSSGLAIRVLDDLELQILHGAMDDVPGTLSQLVGILKQIQTLTLPGNATPVQGLPITPPGKKPAASGVFSTKHSNVGDLTETTRPGIGTSPLPTKR
jgi:hypothetical protein